MGSRSAGARSTTPAATWCYCRLSMAPRRSPVRRTSRRIPAIRTRHGMFPPRWITCRASTSPSAWNTTTVLPTCPTSPDRGESRLPAATRAHWARLCRVGRLIFVTERTVSKSLPLLLRHAMYNLRGGFLVRPLTIALSLGCAGALLSWLEEEYPAVSAWVPSTLFPSHADPQVAQVILAGIAGSIMTVVSIVFAILLMTLTLASMQFSPRIIVSFSRDRVTQWTLGIFLGTFSYCMAALPAARSFPHPFAPVATVLGAMLLALVCVGLLLFFIHHISQAISVNHIVDRIAEETEAMIDEMMPR